jgi:hypothetical protein
MAKQWFDEDRIFGSATDWQGNVFMLEGAA